jgi:AcrR family transcriptional regulator
MTINTLTKSETTVAGILAAAESLFLQRSYSEVSMNEISEAAGITKGGLYHHFTSKEELYLAMMRSDLEAKKVLFERAIRGDGGCRERLRRLTKAFFHLPRAKRELIKLVRRDISAFSEPTRSALIRAYQISLPEIVQQVIADGIAAGELAAADARLLSWLYVALVEVTLTRYAATALSEADARLDFALGQFFAGAAAHGETSKP